MQEAEQSLGYYRGPPKAVLRAIDRAGLSQAVLEIDAGGVDALYDFVEARTADRPALADENRVVRHGKFRIGRFKWGPFSSALPIEGDNLPKLIALVEPPEIL